LDPAERALIDEYLAESLAALSLFIDKSPELGTIQKFADAITTALERGNKIMIAGNGGSAADAQHIAGEFISRLFFDRAPLPAVALTTDTSVMTAISNDYGYEKVFERQVAGLGKPGDVFLGISTSGTSSNVLRAFETARTLGVRTLGFTGFNRCAMDEVCETVLHAPSSKTAIVQQVHIVAAHIICGIVEKRLFSSVTQVTRSA
jgi:D-sedoheptulose 7-phosphate isomerase